MRCLEAGSWSNPRIFSQQVVHSPFFGYMGGLETERKLTSDSRSSFYLSRLRQLLAVTHIRWIHPASRRNRPPFPNMEIGRTRTPLIADCAKAYNKIMDRVTYTR